MKTKRVTFTTNVDIDFKFWSLIPSINLNRHSHEIEFEWLCIGIYTSMEVEHGEEQG